ncbi:hypothetical protein GOP47_0002644 [Adiantum capillus-veneris]|uniref:Zinc finger Mcm10/DnaG-type domain-containing protein n=1 Tax=Adiantum capillus-veneris TaxID=13818 RepID=A0A9D4ZR48_ADICA|nr:hypothetical protein GOP47_0002644 [Adiantum capillus-veneris]
MASDDELELLLAFQSVPETPPSSPSRSDTTSPDSRATTPLAVRSALAEVFGYASDDDDHHQKASMEAFREVVKLPPKTAPPCPPQYSYRTSVPNSHPRFRPLDTANHIEVELHSRLRIRNRLVSQSSLNNQLLDLRFVPLQAIKIATMSENISGSWATIGVLAGKGTPKVSSTGQSFTIWKIASLDSTMISVFLFGEAFSHHYKEPAGCILAIFNAKVRRDDKRKELSLNISASDQLLKLGTSVDFSVCKGKRKDGAPCTAVVNRQHGDYCQYHSGAMRQKYRSQRAELKGGNLSTGLSFLQKGRVSQNMCSEENLSTKREKPVRIMSVKGLKNVLSNADKVTTKFQSQGIRFLACLADESKENVKPSSTSKSRSTSESKSNHLTKTEHGLTDLKRKQGITDPGPVQKRKQLEELGRSKSGQNDKLLSSKPLEKRKCKVLSSQPKLIELDLEAQDNHDDDAMVQAMKLFGQGVLVTSNQGNLGFVIALCRADLLLPASKSCICRVALIDLA